MATIVSTSKQIDKKTRAFTWAAMGNADVGDWIQIPKDPDKVFQVFGTFGGATVVLQGTNDPNAITTPSSANPITLTDPLGNNVSFTSAGMKQVLEDPIFVRPSTSGGSGTSITVILSSRREFN